jgi:plastocyanin
MNKQQAILYRGDEAMIQHQLRKLEVIWTMALLVGLVAMLAPQAAMAAPVAQGGPATWTVLAGAQAEIQQQDAGPAGAWQLLRFYPDTITVNVGDSIVWKLNSAETHTVTFPNPGEQMPPLTIPEGGTSQRMLANPLVIFPQGAATYDGTALTGSGQLGGGPDFPTEYTLTFTKEGTFDYFCGFHQPMTGKVIVQAAGSAYPKTQEQIDADAAAQIAADTQAAMSAEAQAKQVSTKPGSNGTTIYEVNVGWGDGTMAYMRFSPADLTIHVGDTVEWTQRDVEAPHTVTFLSGGQEPDVILTEPQPAGPPTLVFNPVVLAPAGGGTYSGQGYFSLLHDPLGMVGSVTVLAAGAPAQLPVTGGSDPMSSAWWLVVVGLGIVAAGLLLGLLWHRLLGEVRQPSA